MLILCLAKKLIANGYNVGYQQTVVCNNLFERDFVFAKQKSKKQNPFSLCGKCPFF